MNAGVLQRIAEVGAVKGLGRRTVATYRHWVRAFFVFGGRKAATQWTGRDVSRWMHHLCAEGYAPKSRRQALCAVVWVFKHLLQVDPGVLDLPEMPREKRTLRTVPTRAELVAIFQRLRGQPRLMAGVMYGAGLRVEECCQLRLRDLDFAQRTIRVHSGKGDKDRLALLPALLAPALERQVAWRLALHARDVAEGAGFVELPGRLAHKYRSAPREPGWQFLFPSQHIRDGRRWHAVPEGVQKAMRAAVKHAGILRAITPHTLRHAFATHAMQAGNDVATIQELLGHESVETTMIYLHGDRARGISPLDLAPPPLVERLTA